MDWILFLHIFTVANKILLFPLYFFRKNNSLANRMLALLILLPAFPIISNYLFYTRPITEFPHSMFASQAIFSLFGPIYFFYCMQMLGRSFKPTKAKLLHLLPSASILVLWLVYTFSDKTTRMGFAVAFANDGTVSWQTLLACWIPIALVLVYVFFSAVTVFRYSMAFKEVFTQVENFKAGYIREFIWVMIIQILALISISLFTTIWYLEMVWVPIFGNLLYFYIVYKSYNYGVIFSERDYESFRKLYAPLNQYIVDNKKQRYAASSLSDNKVKEYVNQLAHGFEVDNWYLDPELNLTALSQKTNIPAHAISQVVNQKFERNFFDLVNSYRVEELKVKLVDTRYAAIKIDELAFMCGFNSKAAFQRAFKKHTGMTPTGYKRSKQTSMINT